MILTKVKYQTEVEQPLSDNADFSPLCVLQKNVAYLKVIIYRKFGK